MAHAIRLVFSGPRYLLLASAIFSAMLFGLLVASGYVFLEPSVVGHLPPGTEFGFALLVALCAASALVIPMNVFRIAAVRVSRQKIGGSMLGSMVGAASGACSCGPLGFAVASTFGSAGAAASAFLTDYEIPIRISAIAILALAYYTTARSLRAECRIGR